MSASCRRRKEEGDDEEEDGNDAVWNGVWLLMVMEGGRGVRRGICKGRKRLIEPCSVGPLSTP